MRMALLPPKTKLNAPNTKEPKDIFMLPREHPKKKSKLWQKLQKTALCRVRFSLTSFRQLSWHASILLFLQNCEKLFQEWSR